MDCYSGVSVLAWTAILVLACTAQGAGGTRRGWGGGVGGGGAATDGWGLAC